MREIRLARGSYLLTLEILAAAWDAGTHGGDTSTLDRTYRVLGLA